MLICADGRLPEIARCLATGGAQVIADLTAWVSWGREPAELTSVQRDYLLQTRAIENGIPVVAADKTGVEQDSIVYCGRSCVIDPAGRVIATLGPEEEGTLVHDLDLPDVPAPPVLRRPELYGALVEPTASLPVTAALDEPLVVRNESRRIAAVQADLPEGEALVPFIEGWCRLLAMQDCDVVLFAAPSVVGPPLDPAIAGRVAALSDRLGIDICVTLRTETAGVPSRTAHLCSRGEVALSHRQTHGAGIAPGHAACPVIETRAGRAGVMIAEEGLVPEVARSLMLRGAETLLWAATGTPPYDLALVARARADENRCALAVACPPSDGGATLVVSPQGQILAAALRGREMACHGQINRALAHWKDMAPGTHVVFGRQPDTYRALVEPDRRTG
jgi:predicted amidohydrolase